MIVTDNNLKVSKFRLMRGITIFTKFADQPEFVGLGLDDLQKQLEKEPEKSSLRIAGVGAINQILRVKRDREQKTLSSAPALNSA